MASSESQRDYDNIIPKSAIKVKPFIQTFAAFFDTQIGCFLGLRPIIIEPASVNTLIEKDTTGHTGIERKGDFTYGEHDFQS